MVSVRALVVAVGFLVAVSGCRGDSPTSPTTSSIVDHSRATVAVSTIPPTVPGSAATTVPVESDVRVEAGDSIQEAIDEAPIGGVVVIGSGEHREQSVTPREGQHILGEPGAILNGSRLLVDFVDAGGVWVYSGIVLEGQERGRCRWDAQGCGMPEQIFVDDVRLDRVAAERDLTEDTWFYDRQAQEVRLGTDPTGKKVELAHLPFAFGGESRDVIIEGLIIEKYANPAQRGAISTHHGWQVIGNEVRHTHGVGIRTFTETSIVGNKVHHNGQLGIGGGGVGVTIAENEVTDNGLAGFSPSWEAGGVKQVFVFGLTMRDNRVLRNLGPGLWTDAGGDDTTYENNLIVGNEHAGIKHEISGSAIIRGNVILSNGFGTDERWAGILIRESGPVEVRDNVLADNTSAVILYQDDDRDNDTGNYLHDVVVVDNDVAFDGGFIEIRGDIDSSLEGIEFSGNRYYGDDLRFQLFGSSVEVETWRERTGDDSSVLPRGELEMP